MVLIDGKKLAKKIEERVKKEVDGLKKDGTTPGLAVILVGNDPASHTYVKMKEEACERVGFYSMVHKMPSSIDEETILDVINMMNQNPNINGILVQLPLPSHIDTNKVIEAISAKKDVDGFHPYNVGRLVAGLDSFVPCTPLELWRCLKSMK